MSSGMNLEQAKELASKRNYKWAVGNLKRAYGISYKKATKILLYELAETADKLVFCKDCKYWQDQKEGVVEAPICERDGVWVMGQNDFCSKGKRRREE